jgi:hypothetical protein
MCEGAAAAAAPSYHCGVPFKRREEPGSADEEREALREQRFALEDLKRQLAERVRSVQLREHELQQAIQDVAGGKAPPAATRPLPPAPDEGARAALAARSAELDRRERELAERSALPGSKGGASESSLELEQRLRALEEREAALATRERALTERERGLASAVPPEPDADRLAKIEERLAELRESEKLFLRTRDELAARSEAVSVRERLVGQREREFDELEDSTAGGWAKPELSELEQRLRKLEQQHPGEQTLGFSGGFRKLQQQGTRPRKEG